jgi:tRNA G18 (ribose-2'-O)-methylase SpoU
MKKRVELLYDAVRSPYDIAHIIQVALALDAKIYTAGNCIPFDNKKIINKIRSWNIEAMPIITHYDTFEEAVKDLHEKGKVLIGTSGAATDDFYNHDYSAGNTVIVFGTETSGLTEYKQSLLDGLVKLPMKGCLDFLTLPVVTSAISYEVYRQMNQ